MDLNNSHIGKRILFTTFNDLRNKKAVCGEIYHNHYGFYVLSNDPRFNAANNIDKGEWKYNWYIGKTSTEETHKIKILQILNNVYEVW